MLDEHSRRGLPAHDMSMGPSTLQNFRRPTRLSRRNGVRAMEAGWPCKSWLGVSLLQAWWGCIDTSAAHHSGCPLQS